jgi:hypothetical protein
MAHDAKHSVLGQGTAGPSQVHVLSHPLVSECVVDMALVIQGDQNIDIQQSAH